jgi:formylglycine-generating enzyme required for sulfatase activity/serine/threonine protein kinase
MKIENSSFALLKILAKTLGNALGGGIAGDLLVEVLPEVAKDGWAWWHKEKDEKARRSELEAIVQSGNAQLRQEISTIVRIELATQPQVVQQTVELYLTQLPASIRRALRRPDDPRGATVPANLPLCKADDLLRLLPLKLARFKPGDQPLSGVDWQLEQLLGVGGFGEVWKARNLHLQNAPPVALKFCLEPIAARSLRNEARVLDQVMRQGRQPGMVQLLHTYLSAQTPYLEYEFVEGGDLGGLIQTWHRQEGGPTPVGAARVVLRLAEIMAVAHTANPPIVHRDLKPANILVTRIAPSSLRLPQAGDMVNGVQFKIADFGIGGVAAQQAVRESQVGLSRGKLLVSGLQGSYTQHYASPQQMRGDDPDPRDDVFGLGVIWWQMLTGDLSAGRPGGRRWEQDLKARGMTDMLINLLSDCFEENPADRPANAGALVKDLQQALTDKQPRPVIVQPAPVVVSTAAATLLGRGEVDQQSMETPAALVNLPHGPIVRNEERIAAEKGEAERTSERIFQDDAKGKLVSTTIQPVVKRRNWWAISLYVVGIPLLFYLGVSGYNAYETSQQPIRATATAERLQANATTIAPQISATATAMVSTEGATLLPVAERFGIKFVPVPGGPFMMGNPPGIGYTDEQSAHEMSVANFWIGLTEVTNAQYQHFIDAKGYDNPEWWTAAGWQWRTENNIDQPEYWGDERWNGANQPVVGVSWYEATAYATWLATETGLVIDLPTEAQWEKAARGTDGRTYPWGDESPNDQLLNYNNKVGKTVDVGSYPDGVSPYGALDMAGNVWEWTATQWGANYENYADVVDNEKEGNATRALRGGSWNGDSNYVRSAYRGRYVPVYRNGSIGFRLVFAPGG